MRNARIDVRLVFWVDPESAEDVKECFRLAEEGYDYLSSLPVDKKGDFRWEIMKSYSGFSNGVPI